MRTSFLSLLHGVPAAACLVVCSPYAGAQTLGLEFADDYTLRDLGTPPGIPSPLGGVTFLAGDPNTLLVGGAANTASGGIYAIGVVRDTEGHIIGFDGAATLYSTAPYIDGGLAYSPSGTLFFATYPQHQVGQILPGSSSPDLITPLGSTGVTSSLGTLNFVPPGFPGAGGLRLMSYNGGGFYSVSMTPRGDGTYDLADFTLLSTPGGGPEGFIYVPPGSPAFFAPSMIVSEYGSGAVRAYAIDANGAPIPDTRRNFITGLSGAEGAVLDPINNDFIFSTFSGGDRIVIVSGFVIPEPATTALLLIGLGVFAALRQRRRRRSS